MKTNINLITALILCIITGIGAAYIARPDYKTPGFSNSDSSQQNQLLEKISDQLAVYNEKFIQISSMLQNIRIQTEGIENISYVDNNALDNSDPDSSEINEITKDRITTNSTTAGHRLTEYEYNAKQQKIYDSLSNPETDLISITNSKELDTLPMDKRQEVLNEIARRFNNGEIDKAQFIPGYKP